MPGPEPKPDRRRRNVPKKLASLTVLDSSGRSGPIPNCRMPLRTVEAKEMWRNWWRSPQATQWHTQTALMPLSRLARLYDDLMAGKDMKAAELSAMAQLEERFGLTPQGLKRLNWAIVHVDAGAPEQSATVSKLADYRKMIADGA